MLQLDGENYKIQGESLGFANRQKSIFDQLDAVQVKQVGEETTATVSNATKRKGAKFMKTDTGMHCTDDYEDDVTHKDKKFDTKLFKGQESIFKRPEAPHPRLKRTIPDFQRNPHKWKKYSLSDVSEDDMSDTSNTSAAMAFLNEIKTRKESTVDEPMDTDVKITFKKPVQPKNTRIMQVSNDETPGEDGTSYFRGSKLVMPEYVIGEKKKVKKQSCKDSIGKKKDKEIKLNHLVEFDDDDTSEDIE